MAYRSPESMVPDDRRFRGTFRGVTSEGTSFDLEVRTVRRRASGGVIARRQVSAMARGRPLAAADLYVEEVEATLSVEGRRPVRIEFMPGGFRCGRRSSRSLKALVLVAVSDLSARPAPAVSGP